jgi:hypothetical protein
MERIKGYVGLCAIFIFDIIILLFLIGMFFKVDTTIVAGVIGFSGAIIGGAITLIGVKSTIDYQIKRDRLEKLPGMIVDGWKIHKHIIAIKAFETSIYLRTDLNDIKIMQEFYNDHEEWMTELAAKVDPRFYNLVNTFFTHLSDYGSYKTRGEQRKWFEKYNEYYERSSELIDLFEKEYEKYKVF